MGEEGAGWGEGRGRERGHWRGLGEGGRGDELLKLREPDLGKVVYILGGVFCVCKGESVFP